MGQAAVKRESFPETSRAKWLNLRTKDITSTEAAALFGLSPYLTPFELWHRKKAGNVVEVEPNERMRWGTRLQDSIAAGIAEDQKWRVARRSEYQRLPEQRLGSSFDFTILGGKEGDGLLEIKNVDPLAMRDDWIIEDESAEAPPHIEMQVQHQLLVSGLPYAYIGALVGGNRTVLIRRLPVPSVIQGIVTKAEQFWESIDANREPKPNFAKDSQFIAQLYKAVRPGSLVNLSEDNEVSEQVAEYIAQKSVIDQAQAKRDEIKAKILTKVGDAEKLIGNGFSISLGTVKGSRVESFDRPAFRNFRVNVSKK